MKMLSRIVKVAFAIVLVIALIISTRGLMDARVDYDVSTAGVSIPQYTAIDIPFEQNNDFSTKHKCIDKRAGSA